MMKKPTTMAKRLAVRASRMWMWRWEEAVMRPFWETLEALCRILEWEAARGGLPLRLLPFPFGSWDDSPLVGSGDERLILDQFWPPWVLVWLLLAASSTNDKWIMEPLLEAGPPHVGQGRTAGWGWQLTCGERSTKYQFTPKDVGKEVLKRRPPGSSSSSSKDSLSVKIDLRNGRWKVKSKFAFSLGHHQSPLDYKDALGVPSKDWVSVTYFDRLRRDMTRFDVGTTFDFT